MFGTPEIIKDRLRVCGTKLTPARLTTSRLEMADGPETADDVDRHF
jgi:hypothetical protein